MKYVPEEPDDDQPLLVARMQTIARGWNDAADQRSIFLTCYALMTGNMLSAVAVRSFEDPAWAEEMVHRFARYYFDALSAYDATPDSAPRVWQVAHNTCAEKDVWAIQKLLLGINAHINYDLVLTLDEMLSPEWAELAADRRESRRRDYLRVNDIIARTIDAVQDDVLAQAMPIMRYIDLVMGPGDEFLLSGLLMRWRDRVWAYGVRLVEAGDLEARDEVIREMEEEALSRAQAICLANGPASFWGVIR